MLTAMSLGLNREQMDQIPPGVTMDKVSERVAREGKIIREEPVRGVQKPMSGPKESDSPIKVGVTGEEQGARPKETLRVTDVRTVTWPRPPPSYPLTRSPDITQALEEVVPTPARSTLAGNAKPLGMMGNEHLYRTKPPKCWADEEPYTTLSARKEGSTWKMPPGINLAACVHAVRRGDTDPERRIYSLEGRVEGVLG